MTDTNNTTKKAITAKVDLGFAIIDGLMLPNGDFAVGQPQVCEIFSILAKNASRELKAILGEDISFLKTKSDLNSKAINILTLDQFKQVIKVLALRGHKIALAFLDAIIDEGLDRRFNRAFDVKVTEDEYNEKVKFRVLRVKTRLEWTDVLMDRHIKIHGCKPSSRQYAYWTKRVNMALFGQPNFNYDRDTMTEKQQVTQHFEICAVRWSEQNPDMDCEELLEMMLERY